MSNLHTGRLGKCGMKYESTWSTFVTADRVLRILSESIKPEVGKANDDALIGENFTTDRVKVSENYSGGVEMKAHPEELGPLFYWTLGNQAAVTDPVDAYAFITYTGSENYWRLTKSAGNLTSETSSDGSSWSADNNFGTTGVLDLTNASYDTVAEMVTEIDGYSDYIASYKGKAAADSSSMDDFAATNGKEAGDFAQMIIMRSKDATSTTAKLHAITPANASTKLPSASLSIDRTVGTNQVYGYTGTKVASATFNVSANDLAAVSLTVSAKDEETGKTDLAITTPTNKAIPGATICMWINGIHQDEVKDFNLGINSNITQDNVLCSYNIIEQIRQSGEITFSATMNMDTTTTTGNYQFRAANFIADKPVEIVIYIQGTNNADTVNSIPFSGLIRINRLDLDDFAENLSGPDIITIPLSGVAINSTAYEHIEIEVTDDETTTYS
jgi:hypothetical protein